MKSFLTDSLKKSGGNIGYGIAPMYRGKGYGKLLLHLLLQKANEAGVEKALLTIAPDNLPSIAVAMANGGTFAEETDEYVRVWVDTCQ